MSATDGSENNLFWRGLEVLSELENSTQTDLCRFVDCLLDKILSNINMRFVREYFL